VSAPRPARRGPSAGLACAAAIAAIAAPAAAQERRDDEKLLFPPELSKPADAPPADRPPEGEIFGAPAAPAAPREAGDAAERRVKDRLGETEDPLKLGGLLYLRSALYARRGDPPSAWTLTAPDLLDVYLDARPNDRVRGFALARTLYDPTQPAAGSASPTAALAGARTGANPRGLLDQLWLRFDLGRAAFLTVGKQHAKWGTGRFWNPTDYLHVTRRDPLALFDDRTGTAMVRVHVPWEKRGWNLYAVAAAEPLVTQPRPPALPAGVPPPPPDSPFSDPGPSWLATNQLGAVGGGARAEIVLGEAELGLDWVAQRGMRPRYGADLSFGLWELDLHAEWAVRYSPDVPRVRGPAFGGILDPSLWERFRPRGPRSSAVLGAEWSWKYTDDDTLTLGAEYLFHEVGYEDAGLYPVLLAANLFTPFWLGRHYAGAYLRMPRPWSLDLHTLTLSAIGNLSDRSAVVRLDWQVQLLTHLRAEAFVLGHLGKEGGEFRLGLDIPGVVRVGAPTVDVGLGLALSL
jgi:hypothetical protein